MPQSPIAVAPYKQTPAGGIQPAQASYSYAKVAASQTGAALGAAGAIGDVLESITYVPATTAAGVVTIIDGTGGSAVSINLFVGGGTTPLTELDPVTIPLGIASVVGGWSVTTGANVSVVAVGKFS